jgi:hypothetical protein
MSAIQPEMNRTTRLAVVASTLLFVASVHAQDLSGYHKFTFGADVSAIAKQAGLKPADAKTIYQQPAMLQDLEWRPKSTHGPAPIEAASVKDVVFSFYNGGLSRIAITYDRDSTEGMTADDVIDAVSSTYGPAAKPAEEMLFPSFYAETVKVLARWEDAQYSFSLVRSSYPLTFALVGISKRLDALAVDATTQAKIVEAKEAPQKEIDRRTREEAASRTQQEKSRQANKAGFRP